MQIDQQITTGEEGRTDTARSDDATADNKFVVVLNKRHEASELLSALGHVAVGLGGSMPSDADPSLVTYVDADGTEYPNISDWPFIVLRGKGGQMAMFRDRLGELGLPAVAYLHTMRTGGSKAQQERTRQTAAEDIEVLAVATFGPRDQIDPLTKRFSVWH